MLNLGALLPICSRSASGGEGGSATDAESEHSLSLLCRIRMVWDPVTGEVVSTAKNVKYQQKKRQQQAPSASSQEGTDYLQDAALPLRTSFVM